MQLRNRIKLKRSNVTIDLAPLVDVVFQLLIFFMLSSSFTFQSGINVRLPKAVTSDIIQEENFIITITSENIIYLNDVIMTLKELEDGLKKTKSLNRPFLIKSDRRASVGRIVDVWDLCRKLEIERINIATNQDN
jgi:biopolymer transport protein ExbD